MKKIQLILACGLIWSLSFTACKGRTENNIADSAQQHVGASGPADTGLPTTPVETGGQDTTVNGRGTPTMPKDSNKTNP